MKKNSKKAFTLIEILIVVTIIGILSSIAFLAIGDSQAKSRDSRRMADVVNIKKAMQMFRADKNRYPLCVHLPNGWGANTSGPARECSITDDLHGGRCTLGNTRTLDNDATGTEIGSEPGSVADLADHDADALYVYLHPFPVDPHIKYHNDTDGKDYSTYYAYGDTRDGSSYAIGVLLENQNANAKWSWDGDDTKWTALDGKTYYFCKSLGEEANSGFWKNDINLRCKF